MHGTDKGARTTAHHAEPDPRLAGIFLFSFDCHEISP
jgi:hypothetical protein